MEDKRSVGFTFTKSEGKQEVCKAKHTMKKMLHLSSCREYISCGKGHVGEHRQTKPRPKGATPRNDL